MKRTPLRRKTPMRRHRLAPGVTGRRALSAEGVATLRRLLVQRAHGRCEHCLAARPLEMHHVLERSQGGNDTFQNLTMLCRNCHAACDRPYADGRLVIWPDHTGRFRFDTVQADDKQAYQLGQYRLQASRWGGRAATDEEQDLLASLT